MNDIAVISNNNLTMSSREIARLCEKQHGHVCRDIENLNQTYEEMGLSKIGEGYFTHPFTQTRVTGKCIEWIAQRYASELGL